MDSAAALSVAVAPGLPQPTAAVPPKVNIHFAFVSKPEPPRARVCPIPCVYMRVFQQRLKSCKKKPEGLH